jgi:hypothetical protein
MENQGIEDVVRKQMRDKRAQEGDRLRQEKHRKMKRDGEIVQGERTPGGTKCKVCFMTINYS